MVLLGKPGEIFSRTAAFLDIVGTCSRARHRSKGKVSRGFTLLDDSRPLVHASPLHVARSASHLVQARLPEPPTSSSAFNTKSSYCSCVYIFTVSARVFINR